MADILLLNWTELRKWGLPEKIIKQYVTHIKFDDARKLLESVVYGLTDDKEKSTQIASFFESAMRDLLKVDDGK